jgi:HD-GYP domain-containing protein (c-di-GMP phosphodiesterase class II)
MIVPRPYAPSAGEVTAREELRRCAGSQFDPRVIDALLAELERTTRPPNPVRAADPRVAAAAGA